MENISQKLQTKKPIKCEVRLSLEPYSMMATINFENFLILERTNEFLKGRYHMNYITVRINDEIKQYLN